MVKSEGLTTLQFKGEYRKMNPRSPQYEDSIRQDVFLTLLTSITAIVFTQKFLDFTLIQSAVLPTGMFIAVGVAHLIEKASKLKVNRSISIIISLIIIFTIV